MSSWLPTVLSALASWWKEGPASPAALLPLYHLVTLYVWKFRYCLQKYLEFDTHLMSWLLCSWTFFSLKCLVWCHCSHCSSTWLILGCHILHLLVFRPAFLFKVSCCRQESWFWLFNPHSLLRKDRPRYLSLFSWCDWEEPWGLWRSHPDLPFVLAPLGHYLGDSWEAAAPGLASPAACLPPWYFEVGFTVCVLQLLSLACSQGSANPWRAVSASSSWDIFLLQSIVGLARALLT